MGSDMSDMMKFENLQDRIIRIELCGFKVQAHDKEEKMRNNGNGNSGYVSARFEK